MAAALAASAQAATYTVGTTADTSAAACPNAGQQGCSLRQLIAYVHAHLFPPDVINVPAGTYTLNASLGELAIQDSMSIVGPAGARSTTVAAPVPADRFGSGFRVFDVLVPSGGSTPSVSISGLTMTGGTANASNQYFGGDVRSFGTLTLSDDSLTNGFACSGGGVGNDGGSLTIERSLISGNHAACGGGDSGGVENFGTPASGSTPDDPGRLVVDNSTITGNDARLVSGIFSWNDDNNTLLISNSTIAGNSTQDEPGGGVRGGGALGVSNGTERVQNTILAHNIESGSTITTATHTMALNCGPFSSGGITSLGHNIDTGADCLFTHSGDLSNTDPLLGPLQNNGGPTDTLALAANSPARDRIPAVGASCPATDQRGIPRAQGSACDIGAYELAVAPSCTNVSARTPAGGGVLPVAMSCSGQPGSPLTYAIVVAPAHGTLGAVNQANGSVLYTPAAGHFGPDTFTYRATDAGGASNTATATITVPPAVPNCANVALTVRAGSGPVSIVLPCTAPSGAAVTYGIVQGPPRGSLGALNQPTRTVRYTPRANDTGTDRFMYQASDAGGTSNTATGTITILPFPRINSTMSWNFGFFPGSTLVRSLVAFSVPGQASVRLSCAGKACPFHTRSVASVTGHRVCTGKGKHRHCHQLAPATRTVDLTHLFAGRHVAVGDRLTVGILQPSTIGKVYIFTIRPSQTPAVTIACQAPGSSRPGRGC